MSTSSSADPAIPRPPRSLPRGLVVFLRSLPLVVLIALAVLAWNLWRKLEPHLRTVASVSAMNARVDWYWDVDGDWDGYTSVRFASRSGSPASMGLKPADLARLARLHRLEVLDLSDDFDASDQTLAGLAGLTDLRELILGNSTLGRTRLFTDAGLVHLWNLRRLQVLSLRGNPITDEGLASLPALDGLEDLNLGSTKITDRGLMSLAKLPRLRFLNVEGTDVTDEGVAALIRLKPDLDVQYDSGPPNYQAARRRDDSPLKDRR